jgi:phospholipid/cholesterol/gamma-HCH transport system substrate-binding protein
VNKKEFKVGLFVAIALVLLYFGFNYLKGIDFFSSTSKYYTVYENVDKLAVSNPVLVNGYAVGRVSHIKILQEYQNRVLVEIDIDSDIELGDSTKAILDSDFLGNKSILLSIGKIKTPLEPKDTIKSEVAKGMFDVFTETAEPVTENIQTTLRKFNTLLDNLTRVSHQLDTVLVSLKSTPVLLNKTLANANTKMDDLSGSFKSVTENLNGTLVELKPTITNFKILSDSLKRLEINKTLVKTQQTITKLNETLAKLSKGDNTASKLLTEDSLYVNLNNTLRGLDSLANHFNYYPKHFLGPLGKSHKKVLRDMKEEEERRKKNGQRSN